MLRAFCASLQFLISGKLIEIRRALIDNQDAALYKLSAKISYNGCNDSQASRRGV